MSLAAHRLPARGSLTRAPRAAATALAACGIVALAVLWAAGLEHPRTLAALGALAAAGVAAWHGGRRHGAFALWVSVLVLAIVAGEVAAVPLGGQSGRLLWADLVLAAGAAAVLVRGRFAVDVPRAPFLDAMALLAAWSALGLLVAGDLLTGLAELKEWLAALVAGAAFLAFARDAGRARHLLRLAALAGVVVAVWMALVAARAPSPLFAILMKQVDLPWARTNYLAGLLILALPVALGLMTSARGRAARTGWALAALSHAGGLALSSSKGAILAFALALAAGIATQPRIGRRLVLPGLALLAAGGAAFAFGPLKEVLAYRLQASAIGFSMTERQDLYALAWDAFVAHPLTGIGLNNFSVLAHALRGQDTVPHHYLLGFLAELGLAGAALAVVFAWTLLAAAWRACRVAASPGAAALAFSLWVALLGFALHNQIESTIYGQQYKFMLVAIGAAAWRLSQPGEKDSLPSEPPPA